MSDRVRRALRRGLLLLAAVVVFAVAWVLRYNEPEGSFAGLTDDHWFYVVQGWQLLYGELPDRDFNDPGAPLTYVVSAALQAVLGRSVWSEYAFCVLALSAGAAITCLLAARASGSVLLGLGAAAFEIALRPRLYNWPKILVYAVGIAAIWFWLAAPRTRRTWLVAGITALAFLLRHDHGIYVGAAFAVALFAAPALPWGARFRQGGVFALTTLLLLAPYLVYLQSNGGIVTHFAAGARYSARDYERSPLTMPVPRLTPMTTGANADEPAAGWWERDPFAALDRFHYEWWLYWMLALVPVAALALLAAVRRRTPARWPAEQAAVLALAVLALVLHYRLVRGNLEGRFADVAVPASLLLAWIAAAGFRLAGLARAAVLTTLALVMLVTGAVLATSTGNLVRTSSLLDGLDAVSRDSRLVTRQLEQTWPLEMWTEATTGQVGLARYLRACTNPDDRVLMTDFWPPVYGLAQRGFAGGRLDLRGGFYDRPDERRATVERLQKQGVPVVIGPTSAGAAAFSREFPEVADYLEREYRSAGEKDMGGGLTFALLVHRSATPAGVYEPLGFPCFR